jgi:LysM repeat protein
MYVRYVASHPALPAERRMRTHHTAQSPRTATPPGRKAKDMNAKDMNVRLDSTTATSATSTAMIGRPRPAPLRITKRGRAVVTLLAAIPLVAGALVFAVNGGMATATQTGSSATFEAATFDYVTVASGQSLWQLAAALAPSADPRDVVSDIVHLNQLDGADVQPGQRLAIPVQYSR